MRLLPFLAFSPLAAYAAPTFDQAWRGSSEDVIIAPLKAMIQPFSFLDKAFDFVREEIESNDKIEGKTILQLLKDDSNYSKILKLVQLDGLAAKMLDDRSKHITFFAPNDDAFPKNPHDKHDSDMITSSQLDAATVVQEALELSSLDDLASGSKHDEERKRKFRAILRGVLEYHSSAHIISSSELIRNSTISTNLHSDLGALYGEAQRLKISRTLLPVPTVKLNDYARIIKSDGMANNGVLHGIDKPLFPPLDIFVEAFIFPKIFSTTTSALQKVGLDEYLTFSQKEGYLSPATGQSSHTGPPAVTAFAPTNAAWNELPEKLSLFLFSPFGGRALKRLLEYHVLPGGAAYSEVVIMKEHHHHHKHHDDLTFAQGGDHFVHNVTVPTAAGSCVNLFVKKEQNSLGAVEIVFEVNDQKVSIIDVPSRNGVIQVMDKVLIPGGRSSWDGWDEGRDGWFGHFVEGKKGHCHESK